MTVRTKSGKNSDVRIYCIFIYKIFGRKAVVVAGLINLVCGIVFAVILIKHESSIEQPIIPIKIIKNIERERGLI